MVETHSEHIIDGARVQMAKLKAADQMLVNFMQQSDSAIRISAIEVSSAGELSMWPKGFFFFFQRDLREIMMLRRNHVYNR